MAPDLWVAPDHALHAVTMAHGHSEVMASAFASEAFSAIAPHRATLCASFVPTCMKVARARAAPSLVVGEILG